MLHLGIFDAKAVSASQAEQQAIAKATAAEAAAREADGKPTQDMLAMVWHSMSERVSRATALAAGGATWQAVLAAGEWRGLTAVRYLGVDAIDESVFMKSVMEASSDDEA